MYSEVERRIAQLLRQDGTSAGDGRTSGIEALSGRRIGLEKESLRVHPDGAMSERDHPLELGSALTHPSVTTDFSEALLEMVTPPCDSGPEALRHLAAVHRFILPRLPEGEHLWNTSMPCVLHGGEAIRIGEYGSSHIGRMKHIYRRGLGVRYGRRMQAIAGIHFNFSVPDAAWPLWRELHDGAVPAPFSAEAVPLADATARLRTAGAFSMMTNLLRVGWLVPYLFGASPAVCRSFLAPGEGEGLAGLGQGTRYEPYGTSLRMGDIGYRYRDDQPIDLSVRHTAFERYVADIVGHVTTEHPPYRELGLRDADGERQQINACRLQIENEFYGTVRPKQIPERGEMPIVALSRRGIRYLELRSVDVDIAHPGGIGGDTVAMLELLMLFAWLGDAAPLEAGDFADAAHNLRTVAHRGREPGLRLRGPDGEVGLREWGLALVAALEPLAAALDAAESVPRYARALARQRAKLEAPELTPSARALAGIREAGSYLDYTLRRSREQHEAMLAEPPDAALEAALAAAVPESLAAQAALEADSRGEFAAFLAAYFSQLDAHAPALRATAAVDA